MRRKLAVTATVGGICLGVLFLWLYWGNGEAESQRAAPPTAQAVTPSRSATATMRAGPLETATKPASDHPAPVDDSRGGFGIGEELESPSMFGQIAALHSLDAQVEVSGWLQRNADLAAKHVEKFCEEARRLPKRALFTESRRQRDASAWHTPKLDWETGAQGEFHVPDALADRIGKAGKDWATAITGDDLGALDFSWMRELKGYDAWNLADAGPLKDSTANFLEAPVPTYAFFTKWIKLRFAKALRDGDLLDASIEVRHVADLLHSQGMLIGELFAVQALRIEREAFDAATKQGLDTAGWSVEPSEAIEGYRRLARVSNHFFLPGVDPQVMKRALECTPAPCSALAEGAWTHSSLGDLAATDTRSEFWPMVDAQPGCDKGLIAKARAEAKLKPTQVQGSLEGPQMLEKTFDKK